MTHPDYAGVSLPRELMDQVDNVISNKKHGFKSRAEFFKIAIRELLKEFVD